MSRLSKCLNTDDFLALAKRKLPRPVFDFLDGGAEDEQTLLRNRAAFREYALVPRALNDVSQIDASTKALGQSLAWPLIVAPTGMPTLFHPGGEIAVARAAFATGAMYTLSTMASQSIEDVAAAAPGPKAFQSYMFRDRAITRELIERARDAGYDALVFTVDVQVAANRERDKRTGMVLPPRFGLRSMVDFAQRPTWCWNMMRKPMVLANFRDRRSAPGVSLLSYINEQFDPKVDWKALDEIRAMWSGPLAVKGIMRPEDARRAADAGATAIVLSNHGGRQLDSATSPMDMLARAVEAVGDRAEIILDGGIRRGTDMIKALALGARACMTGRVGLYGLAAGGYAGANRAFQLLREEYERDLGLLGLTSTSQIDQDVIHHLGSNGASR